jgi:hypothetical protein
MYAWCENGRMDQIQERNLTSLVLLATNPISLAIHTVDLSLPIRSLEALHVF